MVKLLREYEADLLDHAARSLIGRYGIRDDFRKPQAFKAVPQRCLTGFGCKASTPEFRPQPVADLDARGKVRLKLEDPIEPQRAREFSVYLHGPRAEAVMRVV